VKNRSWGVGGGMGRKNSRKKRGIKTTRKCAPLHFRRKVEKNNGQKFRGDWPRAGTSCGGKRRGGQDVQKKTPGTWDRRTPRLTFPTGGGTWGRDRRGERVCEGGNLGERKCIASCTDGGRRKIRRGMKGSGLVGRKDCPAKIEALP